MSVKPAPELADFPCRLCDSRGLRLYYTLGSDAQFHYYQCPACGLVNYDLSGGLDQAPYTADFVDPTDGSDRRNRDKDQSFAFLCRHARPPGRFLDVGCGFGRLLYLAREAGWDAQGLELSSATATRVQALLGVPVLAADFLETDPPVADRASFDVVSLRHVLEHLPYPRLAMQRIGAWLKPGGLLLLEMPNIEGWAKRWVRFSVRAGLHRRRFAPDFMAGHCCEYSRHSLLALLARTGFELVRWETYSKKPLANLVLNRLPVGTKARALVRRVSEAR